MAENDLATIAPEDVGELQDALRVSSEVDMTLAYSSEKLANLENLLLHILAGENDIGATNFEDDSISAELIEKAFKYDLLYVILNFELRELDNLMGDLQDLIADALHKISSCDRSTEFLIGLVSKLHNSEDVVKQSQERILDMKFQLAKLQMASLSSKRDEWKQDLLVGVREVLHLETWKPDILTVEQRRMLRMLEKSIVREMELEKKLMQLKQHEENLKLKIRLTEQVSVSMEEAAEIAWSRFLEADNAAAVLMGISKDILGKLNILQLNLSSSTKKEDQINSELISAKETSVPAPGSSVAQLNADNIEVTALREKVQILQEKLDLTEVRLKESNVSSETSQRKLKEMEGEILSLTDKINAAEGRAVGAEEKVTQLTDSNLELTEELEFLKNSNDSNTKKVSILEKQLRELDIQLQHARASSEASQDQQGMLYSAIWDMETLIDELKQKVSIAESKNENAEERCSKLSEGNAELSKELDFLKSRLEFMETSLNQVTLEKKALAKDISIRTSLIMNTVMQLAMERERIQKQLISLTKENKLLRVKFKEKPNHVPAILQDNRSRGEKEFQLSVMHSADADLLKTSHVNATEISSESSPLAKYEVEKSSKDADPDETETVATDPAKPSANLAMDLEDERLVQTKNYQRTYIFLTILGVLLSLLAANLFQKELGILKPVK